MKKQISILLAAVVLLCLVFPNMALAGTSSNYRSLTKENVTMYGYSQATRSSSSYCKGYAYTSTSNNVYYLYVKIHLHVTGCHYGIPWWWDKYNSASANYAVYQNTSTSWTAGWMDWSNWCNAAGTHKFKKTSNGTTYTLTTSTSTTS